jgi:hypothetical protein
MDFVKLPLDQFLERHTDYQPIPPLILRGLKNYVEHGYPTGDFLQAVLRNDLCAAIGRADEGSLAALRLIVQLLHNECPSRCHAFRSGERSTVVEDWCESKRPAREAAENDLGTPALA